MALEMSFEDNGNNRRVLKRNFWMFRSELMKILCLFIVFNLLFWKLSKFCDLFFGCAAKTIRFHFHFSFAGKSALVTDLSECKVIRGWIQTNEFLHRDLIVEGLQDSSKSPTLIWILRFLIKNISKSLRILCQDLNWLMEMKGESSWLEESPKLIFILREIEIRNSHESKRFQSESGLRQLKHSHYEIKIN